MTAAKPKIFQLASKILPHNNSKTVAPPGILKQSKVGRPIIVSSLMRSGTHILIDLLLNNFSAYRNSPLYVDLDVYLTNRLPKEKLFSCGTYVLKTHFPQCQHDASAVETIKELASCSYIMQPTRPARSVYRSLKNFSYADDYDSLLKEKERFHEFWGPYHPHQFDFNDLTNQTAVMNILRSMSVVIDQEVPPSPIFPPSKTDFQRVYFYKTLTRLIGKYSPVINTTVQFSGS